MDLFAAVIISGIAFGRTTYGILIRPYETYRRIVRHGTLGELPFIAIVLVAYFALASVVRVAEFRPFLLTRQFLALFIGALSGSLVSVGALWVGGAVAGSKPSFSKLLLAWGYTLIPTVVWFVTTSLLFVILPPPRTQSVPGVLFSLLFLVFSAALLWWKITLAYLTIRFGLKFDLVKSIVITVCCAPILAVWAVVMYKAGVFRVPFL